MDTKSFTRFFSTGQFHESKLISTAAGFCLSMNSRSSLCLLKRCMENFGNPEYLWIRLWFSLLQSQKWPVVLQECTDAKVLKRYLKLLDDDGMKPQMSCEAFFVRLNVMGVECVLFFEFSPRKLMNVWGHDPIWQACFFNSHVLSLPHFLKKTLH